MRGEGEEGGYCWEAVTGVCVAGQAGKAGEEGRGYL